MTITINLPPATLEELQAEAQATGKDVETVVRDAVDARLARRKKTFAEILTPIHDEVASRLNDNEVNAVIDQALKESRAEQGADQARP